MQTMNILEDRPAKATTHRRTFRVLLVDDHHMMRLGLMALAGSCSRFSIEWLESANLNDALRIYGDAGDFDLVLLDLNLPDSKGLQGLRQFKKLFPSVRLAVFSATEDAFVVGQTMAMGALGFVPKSSNPMTTLRLIESMLIGMSDEGVAQVAPELVQAAHGRQARAAVLSPTQHRVLELVLAGMSNREIAAECDLAVGTVKNTVSSIMLALDVRSRSHLISVFN